MTTRRVPASPVGGAAVSPARPASCFLQTSLARMRYCWRVSSSTGSRGADARSNHARTRQHEITEASHQVCLADSRAGGNGIRPGEESCVRCARASCSCREFPTSSGFACLGPRHPSASPLRNRKTAAIQGHAPCCYAARRDFCLANSGSISFRMRGSITRATSRMTGTTTLLPNCL